MGVHGHLQANLNIPSLWAYLSITAKVSLILLALSAITLALFLNVFSVRAAQNLSTSTTSSIEHVIPVSNFQATEQPNQSNLGSSSSQSSNQATESSTGPSSTNKSVTTITINGQTTTINGSGSVHETIAEGEGTTVNISVDSHSSNSGDADRSRTHTRSSSSIHQHSSSSLSSNNYIR